jgi:hypothetical protein
LYVDGVQIVSGTEGPNGLTQIYLGSDASTSFLNGIIAEVIIFGSALSTANRQGIEQYIRNKYATP